MWGYAGNKVQQQGTSGGSTAGDRAGLSRTFNWSDAMIVRPGKVDDVMRVGSNRFGYTCPFSVSAAGGSRSGDSEKEVVIVGAKPGAGAGYQITGFLGARVGAQTGSLGTEAVTVSIGTGRSDGDGGFPLSNPFVSQGHELFKQGNKRQRPTE